MLVSFLQSRNGNATCKYKELFLHSSYNPDAEAEKFVLAQEISFTPSYIIIVEPCLSYCIPFLKKRFPSSKLCAIRLCSDFSSFDKDWDKVFYFTLSKTNEFEEEVFSFLGEENLLQTAFLSWNSSAKAFENLSLAVWKSIKNLLEKSKTVLATREYFSKRWIKNSIIFFSSLNKTLSVTKGTSPIVITASGPSLITTLPLLKECRKSFFLIAVSSSLITLLKNEIIPDLCISTDGGYWAKKHLEQCKNIPLALTPEAACPKNIFTENAIIPLNYCDSENDFFSELGIKYLHASRNGTVSGTALELALQLTTGKIFISGLDLHATKGFQHANPNALEIINSKNDSFIKNQMTRLTKAEFSSGSLKYYEDWFKSLKKEKVSRVFRLSSNYLYANTLGNIRDVKIEEAKNAFQSDCVKPKVVPLQKVDTAKKLKDILQVIEKDSGKESWYKNNFPSTYILFSRSSSIDEKQKYKNILEQKNKELLLELKALLGKKL